MKIAAICPSFGKPILLQNALAQFQAQAYVPQLRRLFILEDAGQFGPASHRGPFIQDETDFHLESWKGKWPTLTSKYVTLVAAAKLWGADAFCVWDDDDIYRPNHLAHHAAMLANHGWSHPATVYSLYTGSIVEETAHGRFHAALAFRRDYGERVGYWGDATNGRCDYDQGILGRLRGLSPAGQSPHKPTFVMRWGSTQADHCSGRCKGADDATWYTDTPISQPGHWERLEAAMDAETRRVYTELDMDYWWGPTSIPR